jgi:hypothetical protein
LSVLKNQFLRVELHHAAIALTVFRDLLSAQGAQQRYGKI